MIIVDCKQLDPEWFAAKCGIPSSSKFDKIVTSTGEPSKQAKQYMLQLAGETVSGVKTETYSSQDMKRGILFEPEARRSFEMIHNVDVRQVGLIYKDEEKTASCSPDGLPFENCGLEIKCPLVHTHVEYLLKNKIPTKYIQQVQGSMYVTGFESWFFMSYYPGIKPLILRIDRDPMFIGKLHAAITEFNQELNEIVRKIQ